jgi:hypothetical protein
MRSYLKKLGIAAAAALAIAATPVVTSSSADARPFGFHGGGFHHGGWGHRGFGFGPALGAGLAFGALATAPYWYSSPVGLYGGDCFIRRRIVGHTYWGRPIFRPVRVCY